MPCVAPSSRSTCGIAAALVAEGEILAGDHARRADLLGQQLGDEILGGGRGELRVELEHQHRVGPGVGEQSLALVEGGQAKGRRVGLEMAHRVRIEGRDHHRAALVKAARDRPPDHRLVAQMKAVEIAERDDAAAECFGDRLVEGQALHRRGLIGRSGERQSEATRRA